VRAEGTPFMDIYAFGRHTTGDTGSRLRPCSTVVLASVIFFAQQTFAAQQAPPNKQATQPASKTPSPFADSQELLQQGKFEDAKIRIQEELQQNPSNAQGYALLGLV
jgi:cytochrome c-type biogenesis protein CcmH/NrfG